MPDFIGAAFAVVEREIDWQGRGASEVGLDTRSGQVLVRVDPRYLRPTDSDNLVGEPTKAQEKLGWRSRFQFEDLVTEAVTADIEEPERLEKAGF